MDKMKYSVDEIIDDVIKLENLNSKELVYLKKEDLDFDVKENDILVLKDGKYQKDENLFKTLQYLDNMYASNRNINLDIDINPLKI